MSHSRSLLPVRYAPTQRELVGSGVMGTIYVVHFTQPLSHARHYIGWAQNLQQRMKDHRDGYGGRLMAAVQAAGIDWHVVYTETGDRYRERQLKNRSSKGHRLCWVCKLEKLVATQGSTPYVLTDRWAHVVCPINGEAVWQSVCPYRVRRTSTRVLWASATQQSQRPWCRFCVDRINSQALGVGCLAAS